MQFSGRPVFRSYLALAAPPADDFPLGLGRKQVEPRRVGIVPLLVGFAHGMAVRQRQSEAFARAGRVDRKSEQRVYADHQPVDRPWA